MNKRIIKIAWEVVAVLLSLIILVPLYMLIVNSFKDYAGANRLGLTLSHISFSSIYSNYKEVILHSGIISAYKNSAIITLSAVALNVFFGAVTGFIIQRRKSKLTETVNLIIISGLSMPFCAPTTFFLIKYLGLSHTYSGIILVFVALSFPFSVFLFTGYFKSIPATLDESAIMDGCGPMRLFFQIIFPLIIPVTITVIIISFMGIWNDFGVAIFLLNSPGRYTVVLTTFNYFSQKHSDWNLLFADIVLISLPVIILYLFLQKYIVSGLTSGAVKG